MRRTLVTIGVALVALVATTAAAAAPVPPSEIAKIRAVYGNSFSILPHWTPPSEVFIGWSTRHANGPNYLARVLLVNFARNGTRLIWSVSDGRTPGDPTCDRQKQGGRFAKVLMYAGRRLIYNSGNEGGLVSTCVYRRSHGYLFPLDVGITIIYGPDSVPLVQLEKMLVSAR